MRFTLFYRGELKATRGAADKQAIRRYFHPQLKRLWSQAPLTDFSKWLDPIPQQGEVSLIESFGGFSFAPLVSERVHMVAELEITMLRPEPPGSVIGHGGDLDNRIKTLLDALRVPRGNGEVPAGDLPSPDEQPFFCALSDDRLVTHLSIKTDTLLESVSSKSEVVLLLRFTTRATRLTFANIGLGS